MHVVATYNGNGNASGVTIYVDGQDVGNLSVVKNTLNGQTTKSDAPLNIAARNDEATFFKGQIDEVKVFDYELSATEVESIYDDDVYAHNNTDLPLGCPDDPPFSSDLALWLDPADIDGDGVANLENDGDLIGDWDDKTSPEEDAVMGVLKRQPKYRNSANGINGAEAIDFDYDYGNTSYGLSDILVSPYDPEITTSVTDRWNPDSRDKSLFVLFKTGASVNNKNNPEYEYPYYSDGRQCIFEAGGPLSGYNVYIENGKLIFGMWNRFEQKFLRFDPSGNEFYPLSPDKVYFAVLEYSSNTKKFRGIVSGYDPYSGQVEVSTSPALSFSGLTHDVDYTDDGSGVGGASRTRYHDYSTGETYSDHFDGLLGDILLYNDIYIHGLDPQQFYNYYKSKYSLSGMAYDYPDAGFPKTSDWDIIENSEFENGVALSTAYPNPFVNSTNFAINNPAEQLVLIELYDSMGNKVETIFKGILDKGIREFTISGQELSNGMYIYKVTSEKYSESGKVILNK